MITALKTYKPKFDSSRCRVTVTRKGFSFSAIARDALRLREIAFMRIHTDPDKRLIVFEPVPGLNKQSDVLKVGHDRSARVAAKGLISEEPWIKAVAAMPGEARKFEMKEYHGQLPPPESGNRKQEMPPWYIRLMPAFENSIMPSKIGGLGSEVKGIYRYRGGNDGDEVIYIGKGSIRDRFEQEPSRREGWGVSIIEYSIIGDDRIAYEWEAWWIEQFKRQHNGRRPRYNQADGHYRKS